MSDTPRIAVIGGGGFIGRRLVERLHASRHYQVRSIVRRPTHSNIDERIADAFDEQALIEALADCTFFIHAISGDRHTITDTIEPAYRAAERAGCRRLVYLSSAVVHGQAPAEGTDEDSPLSHQQPIDYNLSKILAEERLRDMRRQGKVEIVILRPGIVYGPGSQWIDGLAHEILASHAYLVDGGPGLCNAIHVDNLIGAILRACETDGIDGEAFLLGEDGRITWRDFYRHVAEAVGQTIDDIPTVDFVERTPSLIERLANNASVPRALRKRLSRLAERRAAARPSREMALLHRSRYLPGWEKARDRLGYRPSLTPDEAWRQTAAYLAARNWTTGHG